MRRRTATITFFSLLAAAALVIALLGSGAVNFQALEKLTPQMKKLLFPDGGVQPDPSPKPPEPLDAGAPARPDAGVAKPDAGMKLKLAPGELARLDAGEPHDGLLAAAMAFAQSTCSLSGKVTLKDGYDPAGRVVIYVEQAALDPNRDRQAFSLTIRDHRFEPQVLAVVKDDAVRFLNPEGQEHSLFSKSGANEFRLGPKKDTLLGTQTLGFRGAVHVQCDLDEWLSADVLVLPNTFFSVAGPGGEWKIDGLPKGERTVTAWEPNGATVSQLVKCSGDTRVELALSPNLPAQRRHLDGTPYK